MGDLLGFSPPSKSSPLSRPPPRFAPSSSSSTSSSHTSGATGPARSGTTLTAMYADVGSSPHHAPSMPKPFNFQEFLEKMRNPAVAEIVRVIKMFIGEHETKILPIDEFVPLVHDFLANTSALFETNELWRNATEEELDNACEGLEKYLLSKLHRVFFCPKLSDDAVRDEVLKDRMSLLSFLEPQHLEIPEACIRADHLQQAMEELRKMDTYKAPRDKMICILNTAKLIFNMLQTTKADGSADAFLPILIFITLKANPPHLYSNLMYIQRFRNPDKLSGEVGYYLTHMMGAVTFIEKMDASQLKIDPHVFEAGLTRTIESHAQRSTLGTTHPTHPPLSSSSQMSSSVNASASSSSSLPPPPSSSSHQHVMSQSLLSLPPPSSSSLSLPILPSSSSSLPPSDPSLLPPSFDLSTLDPLHPPLSATPPPHLSPGSSVTSSPLANPHLLSRPARAAPLPPSLPPSFPHSSPSSSISSTTTLTPSSLPPTLDLDWSRASAPPSAHPSMHASTVSHPPPQNSVGGGAGAGEGGDPFRNATVQQLIAASQEPAVEKFLHCTIEELGMTDVPLLLADYKRLAALNDKLIKTLRLNISS